MNDIDKLLYPVKYKMFFIDGHPYKVLKTKKGISVRFRNIDIYKDIQIECGLDLSKLLAKKHMKILGMDLEDEQRKVNLMMKFIGKVEPLFDYENQQKLIIK